MSKIRTKKIKLDKINQMENREVKSNSEIRGISWNQLKGNWGVPIAAIILYFIITTLISYIPIPGTTIDMSETGLYDEELFGLPLYYGYEFQLPILSILLSGALTIGLATFFLKIARNKEADISNLFDGFKQFIQAFLAYILVAIITLLGTLCFIIPGIIASLGLGMTYYIMADNRGISCVAVSYTHLTLPTILRV